MIYWNFVYLPIPHVSTISGRLRRWPSSTGDSLSVLGWTGTAAHLLQDEAGSLRHENDWLRGFFPMFFQCFFQCFSNVFSNGFPMIFQCVSIIFHDFTVIFHDLPFVCMVFPTFFPWCSMMAQWFSKYETTWNGFILKLGMSAFKRFRSMKVSQFGDKWTNHANFGAVSG